MGFLTPDVTAPVRLSLTADQAKREALGRTLGLAGTVTGLVGAVMILSSNPAVSAALTRGTSVDLLVQPEAVKREAVGKALAIIGTMIGLYGTSLAMTSDPKISAKLPGFVQRNPSTTSAVTALLLGAAAIALIKAQNKRFLTARYQAG